MCSVVAVVSGLRPGDSESTVENVLEAEYCAVDERETLERRGRIRVEVIEARQLHRPSVAKVQDHRTRADGHRLRIEALPESQGALFGPGRITKNLITPIPTTQTHHSLSRTPHT